MEWNKNKAGYRTVEEAILGLSQQSEYDLLCPEPVSPSSIEGLEIAAAEIQAAIAKGMPIVIVGDYDTDGITGTAILTMLFQYLGCDPKTVIPKRFTDGYGVSEKILQGIEDTLIVTVDNGIVAGEVLDVAVRKHRNRVVVLDHHLPDGREPKHALSVVDPHLAPQNNGFTEYCGAGLAYKLAEYILASEPLSLKEKLSHSIMVLACFGTIADAMPLIGDNRRIVMDSIALVNSGRAKLTSGIRTLLSIAGADGQFGVDTVSFGIAPLINAPGRLYNAGGTSSLKMLLCDDDTDAMTYGAKMVQINKARQTQVGEWMKKIQQFLDGKDIQKILPVTIFNRDIPEGLVGLVAAKLANAYHAPAIVMTQSENGVVKGSIRSYGNFDVKKMLDAMPELFVAAGGHTGAAGISLLEERIPELMKRVRAYYWEQAAQSTGGEYIEYDVDLAPEDVQSALQVIKKYQPFGHGVPKPVCRVNGFPVQDIFRMGADKSHIKFTHPAFSAVAFGKAQQYMDMGEPATIDLVGTIGENVFQGRTSTQIILEDFRPH